MFEIRGKHVRSLHSQHTKDLLLVLLVRSCKELNPPTIKYSFNSDSQLCSKKEKYR